MHSCLHVTFDATNLVHDFLESPGFRTNISQFFINGNFCIKTTHVCQWALHFTVHSSEL